MIKYYECFDNKGGTECFTIGKIYKINNPKDLEDVNNFIDDVGILNGWSGDNYQHFKPSTLEAFNLQEGIKTKKIKKENLSYLIKLLKN